jgi:hypothetical protein
MKPAPVTLYHATTTGEDDSTLKAFQNNGISVPSGLIKDSRQRNGFFAESRRDKAMDMAIAMPVVDPIFPDEDPKWNGAPVPGRPLLVSVKCDFGPGWELDYEEPRHVKRLLFEYAVQLSRVPPGAIKLSNGYSIEHIAAVHDDQRDGLVLTCKNEQTGNTITSFLPWDRTKKKDAIAEPEVLQGLRDYLAKTGGEKYLEKEAEFIADAIRRAHTVPYAKEINGPRTNTSVSLKYTGQKLPEMTALHTFDGQDWQAEQILARRSGAVNHK